MPQRHLALTEKQEKDLTQFLQRRIPELQRENDERIKADKKSDLDYRNSKESRAKAGTVFHQSNMSIPLTSTVVDHFASQTEENLFGRDKVMVAKPEGPSDPALARAVERWAHYRLFKLGKVGECLLDAQQTVWTHRAQILKAIYVEDADEWEERDLEVLHDAESQGPVEILNHGNVIKGQDSFTQVIDQISQQPALVLDADPTFRLDPQRHYFAPSPEPIRFRTVLYAGARSQEVDSDCFFAPINVRCLDEADVIGEFYDKPKHWVRERFLERPWMSWDKFEKLTGPQGAKRKTTGERTDKAKQSGTALDTVSENYGLVEVWIERDVLGWGRPQRIVAWIEKKTWTLIDYEFQKKVTPHGRHPYTAISPWKPHGAKYWWGYSLPELLQSFQDYIDLQWNRHSFRNSINANPIVGQHPDAIAEKKTFHEIKPFDAVTLEEGKSIQDWLEVFTFPKLDLDTQELIATAIEWCKFWLGISNLARGDYSDVPQNTTLGGQEATLKEASKLSRRWTRRIRLGLEDHLGKLLQIAVATMDDEEVFTYLEGDRDQTAALARADLESLKLNVTLMVGRDTGMQTLQEQQLALQIVERYFSYPPQMQAVVRPILKMSLFMLGYDDVDALLPAPMMPTMIDPATGQPVPAEMGMVPPEMGGQGGAPTQVMPPPEEDPAAASAPPAEEPPLAAPAQ